MDKRTETTQEQLAEFLSFAEKYPQILTKKFDHINGRKKYTELWIEVTVILNSMGVQQKSVEKWQKAVSDWRSKVKGKAAALRSSLNATGGGDPLASSLNENEERLLAIIGRKTITGISEEELGLETGASELNEKSALVVEEADSVLPPESPLPHSPPPLLPLPQRTVRKRKRRTTSNSPPTLVDLQGMQLESVNTMKKLADEVGELIKSQKIFLEVQQELLHTQKKIAETQEKILFVMEKWKL